MREIFQAVEDLHQRKPGIERSSAWYASKLAVEESWELVQATSNDPTPEDKEQMVKEGSDVIMLVIDLYRSAGISPEVAMQGLLSKIDEIVARPDSAFTKQIGEKSVETDIFIHPY